MLEWLLIITLLLLGGATVRLAVLGWRLAQAEQEFYEFLLGVEKEGQ